VKSNSNFLKKFKKIKGVMISIMNERDDRKYAHSMRCPRCQCPTIIECIESYHCVSALCNFGWRYDDVENVFRSVN
jgi:hypothetical protein